jgi:hypothetical protein
VTTWTEWLLAGTSEARRVLTEQITAAVATDLRDAREALLANYRDARAATDRANECLDVVRKRTPYGRKADLPTVSAEESERGWTLQQELDKGRDALTRPEAVAAFDAAYVATDDAVTAHAAYAEQRRTWNASVDVLSAAVAATGAPWAATSAETAVLVKAGSVGPVGCVVGGQRFEPAPELPPFDAASARRLVAQFAGVFENRWTAPPEPEPAPPAPEPTPWDSVPTGTPAPNTADPYALARARGAATMG